MVVTVVLPCLLYAPVCLCAQLFGFSSARKMASVLLRQSEGKLRLYNKGAAEWVLKR